MFIVVVIKISVKASQLVQHYEVLNVVLTYLSKHFPPVGFCFHMSLPWYYLVYKLCKKSFQLFFLQMCLAMVCNILFHEVHISKALINTKSWDNNGALMLEKTHCHKHSRLSKPPLLGCKVPLLYRCTTNLNDKVQYTINIHISAGQWFDSRYFL